MNTVTELDVVNFAKMKRRRKILKLYYEEVMESVSTVALLSTGKCNNSMASENSFPESF